MRRVAGRHAPVADLPHVSRVREVEQRAGPAGTTPGRASTSGARSSAPSTTASLRRSSRRRSAPDATCRAASSGTARAGVEFDRRLAAPRVREVGDDQAAVARAVGSLNSSSVPMRMFPRAIPAPSRTLPSGRHELCMNIVSGSLTPPTPPPATRIGSHGVASRRRFDERVAVHALGGVAADAAAAAHPGDALVVDLDVVRVVGQPVVAVQVDRVAEDLRLARVAQVGDPDRPAVAAPVTASNGPR